MAVAETLDKSQKRMWMKYYCDACEAWETRELFETSVDASSSRHRGGQSGNGGTAGSGGKDDALLYSWGCAKVIHYGSFQTLRVDQLNSADGRDAPQDARFPDEVAAAFPSLSSQPADQVCIYANQKSHTIPNNQRMHTYKHTYIHNSLTLRHFTMATNSRDGEAQEGGGGGDGWGRLS